MKEYPFFSNANANYRISQCLTSHDRVLENYSQCFSPVKIHEDAVKESIYSYHSILL